ncbi:sigma-70 family RNA polymerase sigma factor [Phytoactinopolyspora endophytica]|uniref:sigma-70 family RNA polymerase sigma factor n=1 Tax=Phytoactinopolyspora endophytica TaxID=1642495 RepID=UPI00101BFE25|nr:sigma-70 family RNA polymerase sigma factor [Phytoactinopolyspora endophytica]
MRHTDDEIEKAAERFEQIVEHLPEDVEFEDISELREVAEAADAVRADEARLVEAVTVARARGHSWNRIAGSLGVSRQAARQRYSKLLDAS